MFTKDRSLEARVVNGGLSYMRCGRVIMSCPAASAVTCIMSHHVPPPRSRQPKAHVTAWRIYIHPWILLEPNSIRFLLPYRTSKPPS